MQNLISRFVQDERGANALEYALVLILVAFAIVGGAAALGTSLNVLFQSTATAVAGVSVPAL